MKPIVPKPQRCAIYTRKSTEHNLDLEFNSLDAQREACEAYIKSQAHEGWRLVPGHYDRREKPHRTRLIGKRPGLFILRLPPARQGPSCRAASNDRSAVMSPPRASLKIPKRITLDS
jgi:hypothetical protein